MFLRPAMLPAHLRRAPHLSCLAPHSGHPENHRSFFAPVLCSDLAARGLVSSTAIALVTFTLFAWAAQAFLP